MKTIQLIQHKGRPAAVAIGDHAIVAEHVSDQHRAHVHAKALYALQIQAGERPGPYTDQDAERYARHTTRAAPAPARTRQHRRPPARKHPL